MIYGGFALAELTPEEAAKLGGTELTEFGAIRAGNADGTIPAYTGGLTKPPAGFDAKSGKRPDPFADEKPLFSINAANMDKYADKLTDGTKAVMKRFPEWRIDVYKTYRTMYFPQWILDNTKKFATKAKTEDEGESLFDVHAAIPFPIPKNGKEAMWNHNLKYQGVSLEMILGGYVADRSGGFIKSYVVKSNLESPYWDRNKTKKDGDYIMLMTGDFPYPPRLEGQKSLFRYPLKLGRDKEMMWSYLPGQRRVKLAPELSYDTPTVQEAGFNTYDDARMFRGKMDRYDWKLLGRKEMYVPYNCERFCFNGKIEDLKPHFPDPAVVRFELHRVWIVEATLKPGKRHIYHKRILYLDEDSWACVSNTTYDAGGNFYNVSYSLFVPLYDSGGAWGDTRISINLATGGYLITWWDVYPLMKVQQVPPRDSSVYSPDRMAAEGVR